MAYENQCGTCLEFKDCRDYKSLFDENTSWAYREKGYCEVYKCCYYPDDSCTTYYRNKKGSSSGCFITTIVCDILGMEDNSSVLNTLRSFRDNVLQKDEKYKEVLYEYDTVGPIISRNLSVDFVDKEDKELPNAMLDYFILPTVELVNNKKYDEAVNKYIKMVNSLKDYYAIDDIEIEKDKNYDYKKGGHGKVLVKNM